MQLTHAHTHIYMYKYLYAVCVCCVPILDRLECLSQRLNGVYGCTGAAPYAFGAVSLILLTVVQNL